MKLNRTSTRGSGKSRKKSDPEPIKITHIPTETNGFAIQSPDSVQKKTKKRISKISIQSSNNNKVIDTERSLLKLIPAFDPSIKSDGGASFIKLQSYRGTQHDSIKMLKFTYMDENDNVDKEKEKQKQKQKERHEGEDNGGDLDDSGNSEKKNKKKKKSKHKHRESTDNQNKRSKFYDMNNNEIDKEKENVKERERASSQSDIKRTIVSFKVSSDIKDKESGIFSSPPKQTTSRNSFFSPNSNNTNTNTNANVIINSNTNSITNSNCNKSNGKDFTKIIQDSMPILKTPVKNRQSSMMIGYRHITKSLGLNATEQDKDKDQEQNLDQKQPNTKRESKELKSSRNLPQKLDEIAEDYKQSPQETNQPRRTKTQSLGEMKSIISKCRDPQLIIFNHTGLLLPQKKLLITTKGIENSLRGKNDGYVYFGYNDSSDDQGNKINDIIINSPINRTIISDDSAASDYSNNFNRNTTSNPTLFTIYYESSCSKFFFQQNKKVNKTQAADQDIPISFNVRRPYSFITNQQIQINDILVSLLPNNKQNTITVKIPNESPMTFSTSSLIEFVLSDKGIELIMSPVNKHKNQLCTLSFEKIKELWTINPNSLNLWVITKSKQSLDYPTLIKIGNDSIIKATVV